MDIQELEWVMDWLALAQNSDNWRDFVNGLMKLLDP